MKKTFSLWLPVGLWMGVLFALSSIPNLRVSGSNFWDEILRSFAHFLLYAVGYVLFFRAINFECQKKNLLLPLILVCFYGLFDEVHQYFVPTRTFQIKDLLVDFSGGFLGYLIKAVFKK